MSQINPTIYLKEPLIPYNYSILEEHPTKLWTAQHSESISYEPAQYWEAEPSHIPLSLYPFSI